MHAIMMHAPPVPSPHVPLSRPHFIPIHCHGTIISSRTIVIYVARRMMPSIIVRAATLIVAHHAMHP